LPTSHLCTLLDRFSRELHSVDYSWGISIKSPLAYFINSGAIQRRQLLKSAMRGNLTSTSISRILKSAPCGNLKSTPVASSPASVAYYVCKLRWNLAVSGPRVLATMEPSCTWSSCSVPWVQVPYVLTLRTLGLKSMAQVHKLTPVAPSSPLLKDRYSEPEGGGG
jgi:hypothetical protein